MWPAGKNPNDIVVVAAVRTAVTKGFKGGFKDTEAMTMLTAALKGVLDKTGLDPKLVDDIVVGSVLPMSGVRATETRMAAYMAGFPDTTSVYCVNRQCSSSLQAIASVASAIATGQYAIGIGAGVETMSKDAANSMNAPGGMRERRGQGCLVGNSTGRYLLCVH